MNTSKKRLGDLLLEAGLIDQFQLRAALAERQKWGGRLGNNLVKLKFITEEKLLKFLSQQLQIPYVAIDKIKISPSTIELIPEEIATKNNVLPLGIKIEGGKKVLFIAMSDPTNLESLDELQFVTGYTVKTVLASDNAIANAIKKYYNPVEEFMPGNAIPVNNGVRQPSNEPKVTNSSNTEEMVIMHDEPGGQSVSTTITDNELPEEAKAILDSTLGTKKGLSQELSNTLSGKETKSVLYAIIETLIDSGIMKESDLKQHLK